MFLLLNLQLNAGTITWDGGGGTNLWGTAANWDANTVPEIGDDVIVPAGGVVNVTGVQACSSIELTGDAAISVNGLLTLTGSTDEAMKIGSLAILENHGQIEIFNLSNRGILNLGTITNSAIAAIKISNITGTSCIGILNGGDFYNFGLIDIMDSENQAMLNTQLFKNEGELIVGRIKRTAIRNTGTFENEATGVVQATDSTFTAIQSESQMINRGLMEFKAYSIGGISIEEGKFENFDSIVIYTTIGFAISNRDTLINYVTGVIVTDTTGGSGAIDNTDRDRPDGLFANHGLMSISNGSSGISNTMTFENSGTINIENMTAPGIRATRDTMFNLSAGQISIMMTDQGISIDPLGSLYNQGQIQISNVIDGIRSTGTMVQTLTGTCTMMNLSEEPLYITSNHFTEIDGILSIVLGSPN